MSRRILAAVATALLMAACATPSTDYASFVNPKIGTGGHGHVFVGANVPFGLVQLGPTSIPQQWDWCSGYHDSDSTIIGFSHTHLSGTGIGDLFDITLMPVTGQVEPSRGSEDVPGSGAWSYGDRSREVARPGYYSIPLERYGILAELTATSRCGLHRYTFPRSDEAAVIIDLENGGCWDDATDTGFELERDADGQISAVSGYRFSTGWARNQKIFFRAEFSEPLADFVVNENPRQESQRGIARKALYGRCVLAPKAEGQQLLVKVGLSPVSVEGAKANLEAELPGWDFEAVEADARKAWNEELGKVRIKTADADSRTIFYTALYHTMVAPSVFDDVNGDYRGSDDVVRPGSFRNYTTFSLWDTYRAAMPLMTLIHPEKMDDIVATMYHIYKEQGDLPVWHLMGNETDCMVGNPGSVVFADAVVKGFRAGLSDEQIMDALVSTAEQEDRGLDLRRRYGYIPADLYRESVATDMEYCIADAALAQAATVLGYEDVAEAYREHSHDWTNFWDPELQFLRGRKVDGSFTEPFDPIYSRHETSDYTEGTGWQYLWLVPQDVDLLVSLFGSREATLAKLDGLFEAPDHIEGENASPDISGLIGQYAHGNEPGHHTLYLYAMLGRSDKGADLIRRVYREMYTTAPDGLAGNEDVGQMSAWYVLSSLGFYQSEPAVARFWIGAPLWDKASVKVEGGTLEISARGLSEKNCHVKEVRLNGQPWDKPYLEYSDLRKGGKVEFIMGE
ncbi:MAG: GH92 family glycosyl hydrolase [Bacteroidales bacterium]|nr:GH92 family glycosyl hydrolase [Bacteroidales bacterium]